MGNKKENNMNIRDLKKITKIFHCSDIHIRMNKRHEEYRRVFDRLYNYIKQNRDDESLVVLTGDILHSKVEISPECINETHLFLRSLSDICPTLLILGNHDCLLNNTDRLDSLTPIVNSMNHPNLIYSKDTEIISIGDIDFYHWSVYSKKKDFIKPKSKKIKICLYHGLINNSTNDYGYIMKSDSMDVKDFDGFDYTFAGDIHTHQYLNSQKTIAYCGSLIQQNHGESQTHGIIEWNLLNKTSKFIQIQNDTAFYTVDIVDGKWDALPDSLQSNVYLRVRHRNTTQSQLKAALREFRESRNIIETSLMRVSEDGAGYITQCHLGGIDFRDISNQNSHISTFLSSSYGVSKTDIEKVFEINASTNAKLITRETPRNTVWTPKLFEFDNMFGYKKGNRLDFTNMRGTYGIFAPNASGKSTLLDAITYCLFDKCSKTNRASEVMNNSSTSFNCKFVFELNGMDYSIERRAKTQKGGNVRVEVDFYYIDESGAKVSLNGKERMDTNSNIRKILGSYEDFVLTSFSTQTGNASFIDINQRERKELLCQFMDLNVFEELYNIANEEAKEITVLLKDLEKTDWYSKKTGLEIELSEVESQIKTIVAKRNEIKLERSALEGELLATRAKIKSIDSALEGMDKHEMIKQQLALQKEEAAISLAINKVEEEYSQQKSEWIRLTNDLKEMDKAEIDAGISSLASLKKSLGEEKIKLKQMETECKGMEQKMEQLKDLKYDKNCKFCMDNVFVKDAIATSVSIKEVKLSLEEAKNGIKEIENKIMESTQWETLKKDWEALDKRIDSYNVLRLTSQNKISKLQSEKKRIEDSINKLKTLIESYIEHESAIQHNAEIQIELNRIREKSTKIIMAENEADVQYTESQVEKNGILKDIDKCAEAIGKLSEYQTNKQLYQWYLESIHRDGIPHRLIAETLPQIEEEINGILSQLVEFRIILGADNKNINGYISYGDDRVWGLELVSGMEKFITSLAIRSALISISSLPRPDFLIIDEGFGVLSKDNMDSMSQLFEYLKSQFRFSLVVSHVERMRDMMDNIIEITKLNGVSRVNYS